MASTVCTSTGRSPGAATSWTEDALRWPCSSHIETLLVDGIVLVLHQLFKFKWILVDYSFALAHKLLGGDSNEVANLSHNA